MSGLRVGVQHCCRFPRISRNRSSCCGGAGRHKKILGVLTERTPEQSPRTSVVEFPPMLWRNVGVVVGGGPDSRLPRSNSEYSSSRHDELEAFNGYSSSTETWAVFFLLFIVTSAPLFREEAGISGAVQACCRRLSV